MASTGQNYAVGIGTGAASGAATGSVFGPWGTLIGGVVGAGAGAIGAAVKTNAEADERDKLKEEQRRRRKQMLIDILQRQAAEYGQPTEDIEAIRGVDRVHRAERAENQGLADAQQLDPQAFLPIAQQGLTAANNTYKSFQTPQVNPQQMQPMAAQPQYDPWGRPQPMAAQPQYDPWGRPIR